MRPHNTLHKLAVLALLLLPLPARAERRTALVIGNAAYEMGLLRNPVHDASDMAITLRQLGFEVTLLSDAARRPMVEAIDLFSRQLRQGGVGLFYFAGHGVQVGGENYLIPLDARIGREQDVPYEAVPVGRILGGMEDADNQLNILILDACRDNPFARQWRASQRGLAVLQAVRGSLIAYATAPGAVASDGDGRNGLYTSYLLQHMTTPGISVEHFFKKVREGVVKATKGRQTPWESSSLIGDFSFAPQATSNAEAVMWTLVEQSSNPEDVATFLKAYPNGQFAPAARLRLQQLQQRAAQQRLEEQNRLAEQERQRREREKAEAQQRAEAQRREEERQRLEAQQKLAAQQQLEAERQRAEARRREVVQRPAQPEFQPPAVQRPQPEPAPPSGTVGQRPVDVATLEAPRPQPAPLPSARRQETIALLQMAIDANNVEITDQELMYTLRTCVYMSIGGNAREEFCGDVKHTISLSGLTVQNTKDKSWLGPARILVASGGAVRRDILNFSESTGVRKYRIESELRSGSEDRGKEWIQLRDGVSVERVAEAVRALSR